MEDRALDEKKTKKEKGEKEEKTGLFDDVICLLYEQIRTLQHSSREG